MGPQHIYFAERWSFAAANSPLREAFLACPAKPPQAVRPGALGVRPTVVTPSLARLSCAWCECRAWGCKGAEGKWQRSHYGSRIMIKPLHFPSLLLFRGTLV